MTSTEKSLALMERAAKVIPGGVNSPVRACGSVGTKPIFIAQGDGAHVTSADGQRLVDLIGSWGPLILGHAHQEVLSAIAEAMGDGTTFGAPTALEVEFAETVCDAVPSLEMVRAVSSGTEATMSAIRLARGFTGRDLIIKVDGGYHGHADYLLVAGGSGVATLGIPGSPGIPKASAEQTLLMPFNDAAAAQALFDAHPDRIAAIIIEPITGNMGVVAPEKGYLEELRSIAHKAGALLIIDEVMTGFRVDYGGAQSLYDVKPDLSCFGKVVGGGLPAACFGGRRDVMGHLAPAGNVYQAGTLSGNPLAMAAGLKTLEILRRPGTYQRLEEVGDKLEKGLVKAAEEAGVPVVVQRLGSMLTLFFRGEPVKNFDDAKASNTEMFSAYWRRMREHDVLLPPSQFEAMFLSLAHTDSDIEHVIAAAAQSLKGLR